MLAKTTFLKCAFLITIFMFLSYFLFAGTSSLKFRGKVISDNGKMRDARIAVYKNNALLEIIFTDNRGKFEIEMSPDSEYLLRVSKFRHMPQIIRIVVPESFSDIKVELTVDLFRRNKQPLSIKDKAKCLATIEYNHDREQFSYDRGQYCAVLQDQKNKYAREEAEADTKVKHRL